MDSLNAQYWDNRYINQQIQWDVGYATPPIMDFFEGVLNKNASILIPGAGNAYEAESLYNKGFTNVYVVDLSKEAVESFLRRCPNFPRNQVHLLDFFDFDQSFDFIVEQTFFCALNPTKRQNYVEKVFQLLNDNGCLVGVLFNRPFEGGPPFGGEVAEYQSLFGDLFAIKKMDLCSNSIPPRQGSEVFIQMLKKTS